MQHPHPGVTELEQLDAAADRRRGFKVWELDRVSTAEDVERAVEEEIQ